MVCTLSPEPMMRTYVSGRLDQERLSPNSTDTINSLPMRPGRLWIAGLPPPGPMEQYISGTLLPALPYSAFLIHTGGRVELNGHMMGAIWPWQLVIGMNQECLPICSSGMSRAVRLSPTIWLIWEIDGTGTVRNSPPTIAFFWVLEAAPGLPWDLSQPTRSMPKQEKLSGHSACLEPGETAFCEQS